MIGLINNRSRINEDLRVKLLPAGFFGVLLEEDAGLEEEILGVEKFQGGALAERQHFIPQIGAHVSANKNDVRR